MVKPAKIAVLGAGLIGKRHVEYVLAEPEAELSAVVDPADIAKRQAEEKGVPWFSSFADLLAAQRPDGVIVATPNQFHLAHGMEAIDAGLPALIEKPITEDVASGTKLVEAAEAAGVPLLIGHHRRHNPMIRRAKEIIESGRLGRMIAVHAFVWVTKPDAYFEVSWRREKGAGPVFINLIHEMDLLLHLCGDVTSVQAVESNAARGFAVEDTAAVLLRFANGALGTVSVSDAIVGPWSWERTARENSAYPPADQSCYYIGGARASLSIPQLEVWSDRDKRNWTEPLYAERNLYELRDPLPLEIRHFCRVVRGEETPLVTGREGLQALKLTAAVKEAARTGGIVKIV
jgi:predicted dehydrogenase